MNDDPDSHLMEYPLQHGWSKKQILVLLKRMDTYNEYGMYEEYEESVGRYIHAAIR